MSSPRSAVRFAWVETGLGRWLAAVSDKGLARLCLGARSLASIRAWARTAEPGAELVDDPEGLRDVRDQLEAYARRELTVFELALDLRGTPFELEAWAAMGRIPFGAARTYGELASELGRPGGARAIGRAAGRNPVPIVVPCHRVVAANGLGGFAGGLHCKRRLLAHEGHSIQSKLW